MCARPATTSAAKRCSSYVRWVMVRKRERQRRQPVRRRCRDLPRSGARRRLGAACPRIDRGRVGRRRSPGRPHRFDDYQAGETHRPCRRHDGRGGRAHAGGAALSEHRPGAFQRQSSSEAGRFGRRLVYGGHVMSLARALSFNGLANAFHVAAINGGRHVAPLFAGDTVFAWTAILAKPALAGRDDVGALRLLTRATRDLSGYGAPHRARRQGPARRRARARLLGAPAAMTFHDRNDTPRTLSPRSQRGEGSVRRRPRGLSANQNQSLAHDPSTLPGIPGRSSTSSV